MTTLHNEKVICSLCDKENEFTEIMSTNQFGSPDLDTRPPEMKRSTIYTWVQQCSGCGYCASNISIKRPEAQEVVIGHEYKNTLKDPSYSKLAVSFLCEAILDKESNNYFDATWALIHAAWVCDDNNHEEQAMACRRKAVDMLKLAEKHSQQVRDHDEANTALLADLLRRSRLFDQARQVISKKISQISNDTIARILDYQIQLLDKNDSSCHTIAEALGDDG